MGDYAGESISAVRYLLYLLVIGVSYTMSFTIELFCKFRGNVD